MPIQKLPLDNTPPPTWGNPDGVTAPPDGSVVDVPTSLRWITGPDRLNYHTSQRYQGDLFYRDLRLDGQLNGIIDFLGNRTGWALNMPAVQLLPGKVVSLAQFIPVTEPKLIIVALQAKVIGASASTNVIIEVVDTAGPTVVVSKTSVDGLVYLNGANLVNVSTSLDIRVRNASGVTTYNVSGLAIVQPRKY